MKKIMALFLAFLFALPSALASILPPSGVDEDFKAWTGIECTPAVILCESLTILDQRGDQGGKAVDTRYYSGKTIPVIESWDGYAKIYYADGTKTGWVRNEYLMMDPSWYICDEDMQVYAYPDVMAPRIAYLEKNTKLPILTEYDDGSIRGWVCVSLRGAAGWIRKTPRDTAKQTWFRPEMTNDLISAKLILKNSTIPCNDPNTLDQLSALLAHVEDKGGAVSGCPFTAALLLTLSSGKEIELLLATDSCCIYRVDGRDYAYARHLQREMDSSPSNEALFDLFGVSPMQW